MLHLVRLILMLNLVNITLKSKGHTSLEVIHILRPAIKLHLVCIHKARTYPHNEAGDYAAPHHGIYPNYSQQPRL